MKLTRRGFLAMLGSVPFIGALAGASRPSKSDIDWCECGSPPVAHLRVDQDLSEGGIGWYGTVAYGVAGDKSRMIHLAAEHAHA